MKVLVTGAGGQLGYDVMNELYKRGVEAVGTIHGISNLTDMQQRQLGSTLFPMDLSDPDEIGSILAARKPDAIIHCGAWTAVDAAEDVSLRDQVFRINASGTESIARYCARTGAKLLYVSTDYVFNGQGVEPWKPDCQDFQPLNVYGRSKLEGERIVSSLLSRFFVVRTAWVFGVNGKNYVRTMLRLGRTHDQLRIVCDQIGTPTFTYDLASLLSDMILTDRYGFYHATNMELPPAPDGRTLEGTKTGYISWYDFSAEIFRQAFLMGYQEYSPARLKLIPVTSEEYGLSRAARPMNSRLDKSKLQESGFTPLPVWTDALHRYLKEVLPELS